MMKALRIVEATGGTCVKNPILAAIFAHHLVYVM